MATKSTKTDKQIIESQDQKKEKKKTNQSTTRAGLLFNVNLVKKKTQNYYRTHGFLVKPKTKDGEEETENILMFSKGHYALTAVLESFCEYIFNQVLKQVEKDNTGLKNVGRKTLRFCVLSDLTLEKYFAVDMKYWDANQTYQDQLPIIRKEIDKLRNDVNNDLFFNEKAHNLLCFMLLRVYHDLIITAFNLVTYANKKSLDVKSIKAAVRVKFSTTTNLVNQLEEKITSVVKSLDISNEKDDEKDEEEADVEEEDDEEKKEVKKEKKKSDDDEEEEEGKKETKKKETKKKSDEDPPQAGKKAPKKKKEEKKPKEDEEEDAE